jgi:hypothetical protein
MEMVDASYAASNNEFHFREFMNSRRAALDASNPDASGVATYASASGDQITYRIQPELASLVAVNGVPRALPDPLTRLVDPTGTKGDVLEYLGDGKIRIKSPWSHFKVEIDVNDWASPLRTASP